MASVSITRRRWKNKHGENLVRYVVRYRLGGRAYPIQHGGSFDRERDARIRRDFVAGELAACRNPAVALKALAEPAAPKRTFQQVAEAYRVSRIDIAVTTTENNAAHYKSFEMFNDRDAASITFHDIQEWVNSAGLSPPSLRVYRSTLRQIFDYAGIDPNPARDKRVRVRFEEMEEKIPPTAKQVLAILDNVGRKWRLPFVLMEQTSLEPKPTRLLEVGDLDFAEDKIRLRRKTVKGQRRVRAREVQVPAWLMDAIAETLPPLEDRTDTMRVFPGFTDHGARYAMKGACLAAGIPHFTPYDLRHRRASLWHGQGVPTKELMARVGHSKASTTLDVYSHANFDLAELTADELLSRCGSGVAPRAA